MVFGTQEYARITVVIFLVVYDNENSKWQGANAIVHVLMDLMKSSAVKFQVILILRRGDHIINNMRIAPGSN